MIDADRSDCRRLYGLLTIARRDFDCTCTVGHIQNRVWLQVIHLSDQFSGRHPLALILISGGSKRAPGLGEGVGLPTQAIMGYCESGFEVALVLETVSSSSE